MNNKFNKAKIKSKHITKQRKNSNLSKGEKRISEFLGKECIYFEREFYIDGLYNKYGNLLYFDFYIPEYNLAIEFDGIFHYKNPTESQKENDFRKNAYCLKNGVNFLRIKYTDFDNIENIILSKVDSIV